MSELDEEARRALEMSEADLNARFEAGSKRRKARVAHAPKTAWRRFKRESKALRAAYDHACSRGVLGQGRSTALYLSGAHDITITGCRFVPALTSPAPAMREEEGR